MFMAALRSIDGFARLYEAAEVEMLAPASKKIPGRKVVIAAKSQRRPRPK